jgi:protein-disulfide isomerase
MKRNITIVIIVLLALGLGFYLFKISPQESQTPNNGAYGNDFNLTKTENITQPRPAGNGDFVLGNPGAKNTAVVYEDFECPACATFYPIVEQIPSALTDTKVVFRHYPLPQHVDAIPAAYAAEAAGAQGKFWEIYKLLYDTQNQWASLEGQQLTDKFVQIAQQAGVPDVNKFKADMQNKIGKDKIQTDITEGNSLKLQGTPTLYFNGKMLDVGNIDSIKSQAEKFYK